jgi:hypothetical protein
LGNVITQHQDISGKANVHHTHAMSDIVGLVDVLSSITAEIATLSQRIAKLETYHESFPVSSITFDSSYYTLTGKNATITLSPTVKPDNATNKTVTWKSSDTSVATVIAGKITPLKPGTTTITATSTDGTNKSGSCNITVMQGSIAISGINPTSATINEGDTKDFTVTYTSTLFAGTPHNFIWSCKSDIGVSYNQLLSSTSGTTIRFNAPNDLGGFSSTTYYINVYSTLASSSANATVHVNNIVDVTNYFYVGQTEPTASNYTTLATKVNNYPTTYYYTVPKRGYVYAMIDETHSISRMYDTSNGFDQAYYVITSPVVGYKLYKTASAAAGTPLAMVINSNN